MNSKKFVVYFGLAVFLTLPGSVSHAAPTADKLIEKLVEWLEAQKAIDSKYTFRRLALVENFNKDGEVEEKERLVYQGVIIDGHEYERLILKNGDALQGDDLDKEQKREKEFRAKLKKKKDEKDAIAFNRKLAARYVFTLAGTQKIRGRTAYVISFAPNETIDLPRKRKEDVLLNALAGTVWIDKEEFALVKVDAHLTKTVRIGLGLVAVIKKARLNFEIKRDKTGKWLPLSMSHFLWGKSMLFKPIRRRETSLFQDFKPV